AQRRSLQSGNEAVTEGGDVRSPRAALSGRGRPGMLGRGGATGVGGRRAAPDRRIPAHAPALRRGGGPGNAGPLARGRRSVFAPARRGRRRSRPRRRRRPPLPAGPPPRPPPTGRPTRTAGAVPHARRSPGATPSGTRPVAARPAGAGGGGGHLFLQPVGRDGAAPARRPGLRARRL